MHDTGYVQFQKFLTTGNGGTERSVAVSLIQHVVGIQQYVQHFFRGFEQTILCDWNVQLLTMQRLCDIPMPKAMENTDVLKVSR